MKIFNNNLKINKKLTLLSVVLFFTLGCFEKDEYESLKAHDKNNNKIIDEFEDYVNTEVNGDDLASQELRELLFKYGIVFYEVINERKLDRKKAFAYRNSEETISDCISFIASKNEELKKYKIITEYNSLDVRIILPKLIVSKEIYKKNAVYNGHFHGYTKLVNDSFSCNLEREGDY